MASDLSRNQGSALAGRIVLGERPSVCPALSKCNPGMQHVKRQAGSGGSTGS